MLYLPVNPPMVQLLLQSNPPIIPTGKNKLVVFPNPVTGELTINLSGEYSGDARITIVDGGGKEIKQISIKKDQAMYTRSFTGSVVQSRDILSEYQNQ
ncbi:MAG: hypothetical protein WKG06_02780 [Segetibacter sp.]